MSSGRVFLKKFKFSSNTAFILEFGHKYIRFYADHGQLIKDNGAIYEVETPYTLDDLWDRKENVCNLQITQNADVLYLWHKKYMKTLTRYGNNDWRLEDFELLNGPWDAINTDDNLTITASGETGSITLTASGNIFSANDVGRLVRLNIHNDDTSNWVTNKSVKAGDIRKSDGNYYQAVADGTTGSDKPAHTKGSMTDGAVKWEYLHSGYGTAKITEYVSTTKVKAEVKLRMPKGIATPSWEFGEIYPAAGYPISGAFWRNRLALLMNTPTGLKCFISQNDDFNNFSDKDASEVVATCAVTVPILSNEYNEGRWLSAGEVLFVGTNNGEFYIDTMTSAEAFGPDNSKAVPISNIGSKAIPPIKINGHTLFVDRFGTSIRDLIYSYERDGYDPFDASIKGKHLLQSGIVCWDYQDYPDKILWMAVGDGRIIGFTFNTEQEVTALHEHNLSGVVESLAVIPSSDQRKDDLWVSVKRTLINKTNRCIEWLDEGVPLAYPDYNNNSVDWRENEKMEADYVKKNAWYLDCALSFNRSAGDDITVLGGLDHLIGEKVRIIADGAQKEDQTVSEDGTIVISRNDNNVVIGVPVVSVFKPQKRHIQMQNTSGIGEVQQIDHLSLMLYRSGGGKVGADLDNMVDILYRDVDDVMGKSTDLFTGTKVVPWPAGASTIEQGGADLIIYNDSVYPMTVLAISPHMTASGE
jgi:hypothetical protein